MGKVSLYGGRFHGAEVNLSREPSNIQILDQYYSQVVDPDTGAGLGLYVFRCTVEEEDF